MTLLDQFIASLGFQISKIASFRFQSFWKALFYLLILILLSGSIIAATKLSKSESIAKQIQNLPNDFIINSEGATSLNEVLQIKLPQVDTVIVLGENSSQQVSLQGFKNVIYLDAKNWSVGRVSYPTKQLNYEYFPFLKDKELTKSDLIQISKNLDETIKTFTPLYQYVHLFLNLIVHLLLISILAFAGSSFRKLLPITYKEVWIITCYGITAPILVKTFIELLGFTIPMLTTFYWIVVALFSILTIRHIHLSEEIVNQAS
ncbi:hypothetical protein CN692_21990 [Bacillus sp. AFS002410]|uniref:DUF1189 family protein n=1 Tax=Bacillus sp. AFS002410 TaxID=2033481 RepID=UPI000BEFC656|nr:DUF1189 family protein [Bacillus sp. AFS002410]PEJ52384.1 hypothetical protein CN692_21990 [Bacillus sp. AFS002410]